MIRAGVFGATGYTGAELVQLLWKHPAVEIAFVASQSYAGSLLSNIFPTTPDLHLVSPDSAELDQVDVVFLCLPHGSAAKMAVKALQAGARVIDLSADFRLSSPKVYINWYGLEHPAPDLLDEAVYGLTEANRSALPGARLVIFSYLLSVSCFIACGKAISPFSRLAIFALIMLLPASNTKTLITYSFQASEYICKRLGTKKLFGAKAMIL